MTALNGSSFHFEAVLLGRMTGFNRVNHLGRCRASYFAVIAVRLGLRRHRNDGSAWNNPERVQSGLCGEMALAHDCPAPEPEARGLVLHDIDVAVREPLWGSG